MIRQTAGGRSGFLPGVIILLIAAICLIGAGNLWWRAYRNQEIRTSTALTKWQSAAWAARQHDHLARTMDSQLASIRALGTLISGSDERALQQALRDSLMIKLGSVDAQVNALQALPIESADHYRQVRVRLQLTLSAELLPKLLHTFETESPLIVIDSIDIVVQPPSGTAERPRLTVGVECHAYAKADAA